MVQGQAVRHRTKRGCEFVCGSVEIGAYSGSAESSARRHAVSLVSPGGVGDTAWLVDVSDSLVLSGASNQVGEKLTANLRFIQETRIFADQIVLDLSAGDRSVKSRNYPFSNQFFQGLCTSQIQLTDVSVEAAVATTRGQSFARLNLFRKGSTAQPTKCAVLSDYVTQQVTACLRNSRHFTAIEGQGNLLTYSQAPIPGTDFVFTVPQNSRWRVVAVLGTLVTNAGGLNRFPRLDISEPGTLIAQVPGELNWGGGQNHVVSWFQGQGVAFDDANGSVCIPLPEGIVLLSGGIVQSNTLNLTAGDQWTSASIFVEEWLDNV